MIDTHIHFTENKYENLNLIIENSKNKGVKKCMLIACEKSDFEKAIQIKSENFEFFWTSFGYHPIHAAEVSDDDFEELEKVLYDQKADAVGEIGLDYHWYPEQKEIQKKIFKKQMKIAEKLKLPVIIHAREALEDTLEIIKEFPNVNGVMHSFAGNSKEAMEFIDEGYIIGISGPITFKNGINQKDVAKNISLDNIVVETDGPYLTPVPFRGKTNLPEYVEYIISEIALQKKISYETVLKSTTENAYKLFGRKECLE